jgi:hypothetical protein
MSARNLPGGKGRPARKADNFAAICEPTVYKMWKSRLLTTLWASMAYSKESFTIFLPLKYDNNNNVNGNTVLYLTLRLHSNREFKIKYRNYDDDRNNTYEII